MLDATQLCARTCLERYISTYACFTSSKTVENQENKQPCFWSSLFPQEKGTRQPHWEAGSRNTSPAPNLHACWASACPLSLGTWGPAPPDQEVHTHPLWEEGKAVGPELPPQAPCVFPEP